MGRVLGFAFLSAAALAALATAAPGDTADAESAFAAGDYRKAYTLALAAIEENTVDIRARLIAGMAGLRLLNDEPRVGLDEVEEHFRMVLELAPDTAGIHYLLGFTLFQEAEVFPKRRKREKRALYEEAATLFAEELTRATSNRASAIQGRAVSLGRAGLIDEALDAHNDWIALSPSDPAPYVAAIKLTIAERRAGESVALLERSDDAVEQELPGLFELGLECAGDDDMLPVLGAVREMVKTPWERGALELIYYYEAGRPDLSAAALDNLVASNPPESLRLMLTSHFQSTFKGYRYSRELQTVTGVVGKRAAGEQLDPKYGYPSRRQYVKPSYPELPRKARVEATVIALGIIRSNGTTDYIWAHSSRTGLGFEESALEAIEQWEYEPGTVDGEPADFFFIIRIDFFLG
ncbi:MAG: energy transducer TonB [Acidobacteriota bacterium]|nr:energy transducer TonB [Acidobacteriota bacterium]